MPARAVVIEKLSKFTGERHAVPDARRVHAADRSGRPAGDRRPRLRRRAVVAVRHLRAGGQPGVDADVRASRRRSARRTTWPPTSSAATPPDEAHHLLNLSFAQYQADRDVVRPRAPPRAGRAAAGRGHGPTWCATGATPSSTSPCVRRLNDARSARPSTDRQIDAALARLRPGDVVGVPGVSGGVGRGAVLERPAGVDPAAPDHRRPPPADARDRPTSRRCPSGSAPSSCPLPYAPNNAAFQREVAGRLGRARLGRRRRQQGAGRGARGGRAGRRRGGAPGGRVPRPAPPPPGPDRPARPVRAGAGQPRADR